MIKPDYKGFATSIYNDWPDCGGLDGFDAGTGIRSTRIARAALRVIGEKDASTNP